jgi:hypothetical protein
VSGDGARGEWDGRVRLGKLLLFFKVVVLLIERV